MRKLNVLKSEVYDIDSINVLQTFTISIIIKLQNKVKTLISVYNISDVFTGLFSKSDFFAAKPIITGFKPAIPVTDISLSNRMESKNDFTSSIYESLYRSRKKYLGFSPVTASLVLSIAVFGVSFDTVTHPFEPNTSTL